MKLNEHQQERQREIVELKNRCKKDFSFFCEKIVGIGVKKEGINTMTLTNKQKEVGDDIVKIVRIKQMTMDALQNPPEDYSKALKKAKKTMLPENFQTFRLEHEKTYIKQTFKDFFNRNKNKDTKETEDEYANKLYELGQKKLVSVMAARGVGKTFLAGLILWWYMYSYDAQIFVIGPTGSQISNAIWPQISELAQYSSKIYGPASVLSGENKIFMIGTREIKSMQYISKSEWGSTCFAKRIQIDHSKPAEDQKAAVSGLHNAHMMFIIDESSAIPDYIYSVLSDSCMVFSQCNVIFSIFNPNRNKGFAIEGATGKSPDAIGHHISAIGCELIDAQKIEQDKLKYGEDSPYYRVSVLGLPPKTDEGAFISFEWIQQAKQRFALHANNPDLPLASDPMMLGVDIGLGGDKTVVASRKGNFLLNFNENNSADTDEIEFFIIDLVEKYETTHLYLEYTAISAAICQSIQKKLSVTLPACHVHLIKPGGKPNDSKFDRKKDELIYKMAKAFENQVICIPDTRNEIFDEFESELSLIQLDKKRQEKDGKIKVLPKSNAAYVKALKDATGYSSPDKTDAFAMTFAHDYDVQVAVTRKNRERFKSRELAVSGRYSWLN